MKKIEKINEEVKQVVLEYIEKTLETEEYNATYGNRYSWNCIYIAQDMDTEEIGVYTFNFRCIPDYINIIEEIDTCDFFTIRSRYMQIVEELENSSSTFCNGELTEQELEFDEEIFEFED